MYVKFPKDRKSWEGVTTADWGRRGDELAHRQREFGILEADDDVPPFPRGEHHCVLPRYCKSYIGQIRVLGLRYINYGPDPEGMVVNFRDNASAVAARLAFED